MSKEYLLDTNAFFNLLKEIREVEKGDSMATARQVIDNECNITVVTSDKGLKACLDNVSIPYWDVFKIR